VPAVVVEGPMHLWKEEPIEGYFWLNTSTLCPTSEDIHDLLTYVTRCVFLLLFIPVKSINTLSTLFPVKHPTGLIGLSD
jgi:hypothetical protein